MVMARLPTHMECMICKVQDDRSLARRDTSRQFVIPRQFCPENTLRPVLDFGVGTDDPLPPTGALASHDPATSTDDGANVALQGDTRGKTRRAFVGRSKRPVESTARNR
jgi:hypothetical protein